MVIKDAFYKLERLILFLGCIQNYKTMGSFLGMVKWYCIACVAGFFQLCSHFVLYLLQVGQKKAVPPPKDPILFKSASRIAAEIREGKLTSENVVKCYIERIREVNPYINAVAEERYEEAINEARLVDEFIKSGSKTPEELANEKPLLGVPISVKLLFGVKGVVCNAGTPMYKDVKAHDDAEVVSQMKKAGAICLVTTNSPEFGLNVESFNHVYGLTRNPHDTRRTAGGSSGGEAALLSAAGSVLGLGNDLIGSLRFPAFCTGIFSHKPTNGIVSNEGMFPRPNEEFMWYLCGGPMCRYAEDLLVSMNILLDPKHRHIKIDSPVNFSTVKIYYIEDEGGNPAVPSPDNELIEAQKKVVNHFKNVYGTEVKKVEIKSMNKGLLTSFKMFVDSLNKPLKDILYGEGAKISIAKEFMKCTVGKSKITYPTLVVMNMLQSSLLPNTEEAEKNVKALKKEFEDILGDNSVLISPTFPKKAVYHYETSLNLLAYSYTSIYNILGLPSTQCPIGIGEGGLPLGIQVIGAKEHDYLTLAFAQEIEKAFGGWVPPNTHGNSSNALQDIEQI